MTVYSFTNYKDFLKHVIDSSKRGVITRLAEAAGCQRSYLSQALSTQVNLTSDQVYNISTHLDLGEEEQDYLLLLLEHEKAASHLYKKRLNQKLESLRKSASRLSKKVSQKKNTEINPKYYSAWYYSAIHIATSMRSMKSEKDFAALLNLKVSTVSKVLKELKSWKLIKYEDESWIYNASFQLHLDDESIYNRLNHSNWRTHTLSLPIQPEQNINYTSVFTISKKDFKKIRTQFLDFLQSLNCPVNTGRLLA
ncbi:MAG: TIGR02147 family protein [Bdellovibrionales bacterium]